MLTGHSYQHVPHRTHSLTHSERKERKYEKEIKYKGKRRRW